MSGVNKISFSVPDIPEREFKTPAVISNTEFAVDQLEKLGLSPSEIIALFEGVDRIPLRKDEINEKYVIYEESCGHGHGKGKGKGHGKGHCGEGHGKCKKDWEEIQEALQAEQERIQQEQQQQEAQRLEAIKQEEIKTERIKEDAIDFDNLKHELRAAYIKTDNLMNDIEKSQLCLDKLV